MFERYTEGARRTIFFARYEALQVGSADIETEHILLGLLREDKALFRRVLSNVEYESIHKDVVAHTTVPRGRATAPSADLPLSNESKRVLAFGAEEAERLTHLHIGTEHLLLGLLREEKHPAGNALSTTGRRPWKAVARNFEITDGLVFRQDRAGRCPERANKNCRDRGNSRR